MFRWIYVTCLYRTRAEAKAAERGRKASETSFKCFVPAEMVYYIDDLIDHLYNHPGTNKIIIMHEA